MSASHEDLRNHLRAVIEAAPELSPDTRQHLADVFLDEMTSRYRLVPRESREERPSDVGSAVSVLLSSLWRKWPLLVGVAALLVTLPVLLISLFVLVHVLLFGLFVLFHLVPLLIVVVFVFFMFRHPGRRMGPRRPVWR